MLQPQPTPQPPPLDAAPISGTEVYHGLSVKYVPAPLFKRVMAYAVDLAIVSAWVYLLGIGVAFFGIVSFSAARAFDNKFFTAMSMSLVLIAAVIGLLAILHGYFVYNENKTGSTPGKRLFGLRVVSLTGRRLTLGQCVRRDLMRFVDCVLIFPGLISMVVNAERRRLGDLLAGTLVVHSALQEKKHDFLYVGQEDYYLHLQRLAPKPVTAALCREYLAAAYPLLQKGDGTNTAQLAWCKDVVARYVADPAASGLVPIDQVMFFAEYCNQTLNTHRAHGDHANGEKIS